MKLATKIMAGTAALAFLTLATGSQAQVTLTITLSGSVSVQGATNDNGTVTAYASPAKKTFATKDILKNLALDEYAENNFPSNSFPAGAKLVVVTGNNNGEFLVVDKSGTNVLVDVSDIIFAQDGIIGNYIASGKQNDTTGLASPSKTYQHVFTIGYDDSKIPGGGGVGFQFYMTGLMTDSTTDTTPNATTGAYTESKSAKMSAIGEGNYQGQPFVLTGSLNASGKATLSR